MCSEIFNNSPHQRQTDKQDERKSLKQAMKSEKKEKKTAASSRHTVTPTLLHRKSSPGGSNNFKNNNFARQQQREQDTRNFQNYSRTITSSWGIKTKTVLRIGSQYPLVFTEIYTPSDMK